MTEPPTNGPGEPETSPPPPAAVPSSGLWERFREHKILQWSLGYLGAALALAHGAELLGHTFRWPEFVQRLILGALIVGLPLVLTLAWYHGHKGLKGVSQGELMIASILLLIGAGLLIVLVRPVSDNGEAVAAHAAPSSLATVSTATPAAPRTAVAVLPFANLTGDPSKEYLGDGMAEELINTLTKVQGLKVPARTSTFAYKGRNTDIRQIAKDLGVGTILEGSVQAAGKHIRITAQLINAQDGLHLWSETYNEEFTDIFKLQDTLATAIATALQPNLLASAQAAVSRERPTLDVEAYNLYLQGWSLLAIPSVSNFRQAIVYFQQAIGRDAKFARAYAGIAEAHTAWYRLTWEFNEHADAAVHYARLALALDPHLDSAHSPLAMTASYRRQLFEMEAHSRTALATAGNDGLVHAVRAISLYNTGHIREVLREAEKGYGLAPANATVIANLAFAHSLLGHDVEALRFANAAAGKGFSKTSNPLHNVYGLAAMRAGHYQEVVDDWSGPGMGVGFESSPAGEVTRLILAAMADPTRRQAALAARARLFPKVAAPIADHAGNAFSTCLYAAIRYAYLTALDVAFDLGNQCIDDYQEGQMTRLSNLWVPELRTFRKDPRFQPLATRLGLMEYWEQYGPPDDCDLKDGKLTCR
jgi:TolB-like protein